MSFFKRKEKDIIPPVPSETAREHILSRDGGSYNGTYIPPPPPSSNYSDRYSRKDAVGDVYSRSGSSVEKDRSELFSGYNLEKAGSGRFFNDDPGSRGRQEPAPGEEDEEDIEGIKSQIKSTKQESLASTRSALRLAREAEETARNTVGRLGAQSEKLASIERHLDITKGYSQRAEDKTDELKQLNRSIFRPVIAFNKDEKRAAQAAKIQQRYEDEREQREKAMMDVRETQDRLGRAAASGQGGGRSNKTSAQLTAKREQRKKYQFEATASDDELEDELDDNLDEIYNITKNLKALSTGMGEEIDSHIIRVEGIANKADSLDNSLFKTTQRLNNIS